MITFEQLINKDSIFYLLYVPFDLSVPRQLVPIRVKYNSNKDNYTSITFVNCDDLFCTYTVLPTRVNSFLNVTPNNIIKAYNGDWMNGRPSGNFYITQDKIFLKDIIRDTYRILQAKSMTKTAPMSYKIAIQILKNLK